MQVVNLSFRLDTTVPRIEMNKRKTRKNRQTPDIPPKNYVVCECLFCSHRNVKRVTPRGYMNYLYPTKPKTPRVDSTTSATRKSEQLDICIDKARVDYTGSAMRKSEHLVTFVISINKARVDTTKSTT